MPVPDNPITPFNLRNEIPDVAQEVAATLISGWVEQIRAGKFADVSDMRRTLFADRPYSLAEQLDEATTNLVVALAMLALLEPE